MMQSRRLLLRGAVLGLGLLLLGWALSSTITVTTSGTTAGDDSLGTQQPTAGPEGHPAIQIPVSGVKSGQLRDTYGAPRSGGRLHEAIDILAPKGTPVRAAVPGTVAQIHRSEGGGRTVYQYGPDSSWIYFYAHLNRYANELDKNRQLQRGQVIGYVGDTGNAPDGVYHLHFAIWTIDDPDNFWHGAAINPYPLLKESRRLGAP